MHLRPPLYYLLTEKEINPFYEPLSGFLSLTVIVVCSQVSFPRSRNLYQ